MAKWRLMAAGALALAAGWSVSSNHAQAAQSVTLTGEVIDTWCYFSGVMGGPEATQGTAHHTCALWCAAGGIPVGLLTESGDVYMVLSYLGADPVNNDAFLDIQSHQLTVAATVYERDGLSYITINEVIEDAGITNVNHDEWGTVPGFVIPELN